MPYNFIVSDKYKFFYNGRAARAEQTHLRARRRSYARARATRRRSCARAARARARRNYARHSYSLRRATPRIHTQSSHSRTHTFTHPRAAAAAHQVGGPEKPPVAGIEDTRSATLVTRDMTLTTLATAASGHVHKKAHTQRLTAGERHIEQTYHGYGVITSSSSLSLFP